MQNVHFSPPDIAPLFGVNVSTVKRWIDRGLLKSDITSGGHRRVSREQLTFFIQAMPTGARRSYVLKRMLTLKEEAQPGVVANHYQKKLQQHPDEARMMLEQLIAKRWSMARIIDDVVAPTLRWIGSEWEAGRMSIYEEHQLSFQVRLHLLRLDDLLPRRSTNGDAILACPAGEQHELPLQMLALILRQHGWRPQILGINIPIRELEKAQLHFRAKVMLLSSTYRQSSSAAYLSAASRIAKRRRVALLFGGAGWPSSLQKSAGAATYTRSAGDFEAVIRGLAKRR